MQVSKLQSQCAQRMQKGEEINKQNKFFLQNANSLPCGVDTRKFTAVLDGIQRREAQRIRALATEKGRGGEGLKLEDFKLRTTIGRGGFGKVTIFTFKLPFQVFLAQRLATGKLYAVKAISKEQLLSEDSADQSMLERDVLAMGTGCTFLTALSATFQTNEHLYFVIEFVVGGDLLFHLMKVGHHSSQSFNT